MSKTKGNVVDPLGVIDEPAPTRCGSRSSTARRPGRTSASARPSSRTPATSPTSSGTRRGSWSERGRHRSPPTPSAGCPTRATSARPSAGCCPGPRRRPRPSTQAIADFGFGEMTRRPLRRDLERVLRLGPRARQGPARGRVAGPGGPRGDVVDAGRRPRHVPAPAPPGHAVRDGGALGGDPAPRHRPGAAHRRPLARRRGSAISSAEAEVGTRGRRSSRRSATPGRRRTCRPGRSSKRASTCRPGSARRSRRSGPRSSGWPGRVRSTAT